MAKARSPGYPAIGLKEAIDKIAAIYSKDYQNKTSREVVGKHMGYDSLHGKALSVLSALGKFGLLEGRGEVGVSDLAVRIIAHEPGDPERIDALKEAACSPELFADLDSRFSWGKASDSAIRSYLLKQRFIPSAADLVIRSYRETKQLVEDESSGYDVASLEPGNGETESGVYDEQSGSPIIQPAAGQIGIRTMAPQVVQEGEREFLHMSLSEDSAVRIIVKGPMTHKELKKLRQLIFIRELWDSLDKGEKSELKQELDQKLDEASEPD